MLELQISFKLRKYLEKNTPESIQITRSNLKKILDKNFYLEDNCYKFTISTGSLHLVKVGERNELLSAIHLPNTIVWHKTFYPEKIVIYPHYPSLNKVNGYIASRVLAKADPRFRFMNCHKQNLFFFGAMMKAKSFATHPKQLPSQFHEFLK